jgi:hypothetical protein
MKILISLNSGNVMSTEQKIQKLNTLIHEVCDSALIPNIGMSQFFLAMTKFLNAPDKADNLDDAIFAAENAADDNVSEKRRYPAVKTYEQDLSYKAFAKLKSELKKFKGINLKEAKKHLALFDRLAALNNSAQSLINHKFDPEAKYGHHKTLRDTLSAEGIFYIKEKQ